MTHSLLNILKFGPPPPQVVLLPDEMFFTRSLPVPAGSDQAAVAAQVELALETLSPFPRRSSITASSGFPARNAC